MESMRRCEPSWTVLTGLDPSDGRAGHTKLINDSSVDLSDLRIATLSALSLLSSMQIPTDVDQQKMQLARRMQSAALEGRLKAKHSARSTRRLVHIVRQTMASY